MQLEHSADMIPFEVEAQAEGPRSVTATSKSRSLALGSATLLIAGVVAFQSGTFAPGKPAGATSLIAQDDLISAPEMPSFSSGQSADPANDADEVQDRLAHLTCDVMPMALATALDEAEATLHLRCLGGRCSFGEDMPQDQVDDLENAAKNIADHVRAADTRHCLAETMADNVVQTSANSLQVLWAQLLAGASTEPAVTWDGQSLQTTASVHERLQQSSAAIGTWRHSMLAGADSILDRRLVLPMNVEDPGVCPEPCIRCTTEHNSIFEGDEDFSFKCILPRRGAPPSSSDLHCQEPVQRSGIAGQLHGQTKTWCDVRSWRAVHDQAIALSADVTCGAQAILGPLRHGIEMEDRVREACQSVERRQPTESLVMQSYNEFATVSDDVASPGENAAFRILMELGMAEGLADLRRATTGNTVTV